MLMKSQVVRVDERGCYVILWGRHFVAIPACEKSTVGCHFFQDEEVSKPKFRISRCNASMPRFEIPLLISVFLSPCVLYYCMRKAPGTKC